MEREVKYCGVTVKAFRGDHGIFKSTEFRLELKDNDQVINSMKLELTTRIV